MTDTLTDTLKSIAVMALIVAIAAGILELAIASTTNKPALQCTVDDHLSFTIPYARRVIYTHGMLHAGDIHRNMLPGETCTRVAEIDWSLAR